MSKENQELVLANRPNGLKDLKNIWKLQSLPIPKAGENEVVFETLYISVDPYLSSGLKKSALGGATNEIGSVQKSLTVVKVIESNNKKYPVGTVVLAINPWQRYFLHKGDDLPWGKIIKKPGDPENAFDRLGHQSALGAFGMPSMTGYYGIKDVGKYTSNDILVVSGAAGGVGSVAGQYAKHVIKCKKVIGTAGGKAKCDYLLKELGFDAAVDYKEYDTKEKMAKRLQELAGEPITGYFDNTGGHVTDAIFDIIAKFGKIVICGQISTYNNSEETEKETNIYPNYLAKTIYKSLTVIGYTVADFMSRNEKEFYAELPPLIEKGTIKTKDTIVEGFEKTPEAYEMLYTGANTGKVIVKI